MSVFGHVPTGMSPQSASRGPVERGFVERIHCPDTEQLAASVGGLGRTYDDFCLIFGIPSWLMPARDRSGQRWQPSGKPYVVAATEACSRFIGTCGELSPLLPLPSPFLSLLSGVFLNVILRISPFLLWCVPGRLFVAGKTFLSLFSLSLSLSLFLSFSFSSLHPLPWASLDAFVIAGSPSFLVCPWTLVP